jgi:hypothetical protein
MVGAVIGLRCVGLVGFAVGMGVGTLAVGVCWDLLRVVGAIMGDIGMARQEQRIRGVTVGCCGCMGASHDASTFPCVCVCVLDLQ